MSLNPDTYDRLHALYKRFDTFPEATFPGGGGAVLNTDAYLAFLDLRPLIMAALDAIHVELRGWRPIAAFFEAEPETACVLLWVPDAGEGAVHLGYWDDDEQAWFRECEGPDLESTQLAPTKWMAVAELMRAVDEREFVAIARPPGSY